MVGYLPFVAAASALNIAACPNQSVSLGQAYDISQNAPVPQGYALSFSGLESSVVHDGQYMGYRPMASYNVQECADQCGQTSGCRAFNVYAKNTATSGATSACAQVSFECALYTGPVFQHMAVNDGQVETGVDVLISNGYNADVMTVTTTTTVTQAPYPTVKRMQQVEPHATNSPLVYTFWETIVVTGPRPSTTSKATHNAKAHTVLSTQWITEWDIVTESVIVTELNTVTVTAPRPSKTVTVTHHTGSSSPTHHFAILPRTLVTRAIPAAAAASPLPAIAEPRDDDTPGAFRGLSLPLTEDVQEDDATIFLPMDVGVGAEGMGRVELILPEEEGEEVVF